MFQMPGVQPIHDMKCPLDLSEYTHDIGAVEDNDLGLFILLVESEDLMETVLEEPVHSFEMRTVGR